MHNACRNEGNCSVVSSQAAVVNLLLAPTLTCFAFLCSLHARADVLHAHGGIKGDSQPSKLYLDSLPIPSSQFLNGVYSPYFSMHREGFVFLAPDRQQNLLQSSGIAFRLMVCILIRVYNSYSFSAQQVECTIEQMGIRAWAPR